MKKAYFSPVASLLVSLSLALGILVGNLSDHLFLTTAHAEEAICSDAGAAGTVVSDSVNIEDGFIMGGLSLRNVVVNGSVVEQAVIAGNVQLTNATFVGSNGVIIGSGSPCSNGVIIGSGSPSPDGVIIGSGSPAPTGVIIGSGSPSPTGVIIGSGSTIISGVSGTISGTAVGGTLTGDDITIVDGVINGQNLLLNGAVIDGGSISGTITSYSITPSN